MSEGRELVPIHQPHALTTEVADPEETLLASWLAGRPRSTVDAYTHELAHFRAFVDKPLHAVRLTDVQRYAAHLADRGLREATQVRALAAVKSLFAFGAKLGYFPFDVGRPIRLPKIKDTLAERILTTEDVDRFRAAVTDPRDRALVALLYLGGARVSEAVSLRWRDVRASKRGGQVTLFGKGGKTRAVLLPPTSYADLLALRPPEAKADAYVFPGYSGGPLTRQMAWKIIKRVGQTCGLTEVSPHWFRHSNASHALDAGCPPHVVMATLGHASLTTTSRYTHARPSESSGLYLDRPTTDG